MAFQNLIRRGLFSCMLFVSVAGCLSLFPSPRIDLFDTTPIDETVNYPAPSCAVERVVDPQGVMLDMPHIDQSATYAERDASKICWAADIAMVATYLGNPRSTCQITSYMSRDGLSCCRLSKASPAEDVARCNQGVYDAHIASTFHQMGIYVLHADKPLAEDALRLELSNGRPVILQMSIEGYVDGRTVISGHAVVIAGFKKDGAYLVHNPSKPASDEMTYAELLHGKERKWNWYESWYHFSYRQDGCNPRFNQECGCR